MAMGKMSGLAAAAADMDPVSAAPSEPDDEKGTDQKSMFLEMCRLIREGKDDEAWDAFQACVPGAYEEPASEGGELGLEV